MFLHFKTHALEVLFVFILGSSCPGILFAAVDSSKEKNESGSVAQCEGKECDRKLYQDGRKAFMAGNCNDAIVLLSNYRKNNRHLVKRYSTFFDNISEAIMYCEEKNQQKQIMEQLGGILFKSIPELKKRLDMNFEVEFHKRYMQRKRSGMHGLQFSGEGFQEWRIGLLPNTIPFRSESEN